MSSATLDSMLAVAHVRETLERIDEVLANTGYDSLEIPAGEPRMLFLDDQASPFRTNPWFAWLVPSEPAPGSIVSIRRGGMPGLVFVAPDDHWHSPARVPDEPWTASYDMHVVGSGTAARARLGPAQGRAAWIGEAAPPEGREANPPALLAALEQLRCRKSTHEIACLREATRIAVAGHLAAERAFRAGASEFDIHLAFLAAVRQTDEELPYPAIVALNGHGATLHYQLRDRRPPPRPLSLLIDAGAGCRGYGSDITRTWAAAPGSFASLVEGMDKLQQQLCAAVRPGVDWRELHLAAHGMVARLLCEAGVLRIDADEAVGKGISAAFLPHGLGHLLGLQVHDVGGLRASADSQPIPRPPGHPALRLTRRLEAGMVVTVEPGLYFIERLLAPLRAGSDAAAVNWTLVDTLRECGGIRIEDDVVVTATGHDNLTRTAFADVA